MLFTGIVTSQVVGSGSIISLATIVIGFVLIIVGLISFIYRNRGFWGMRATEATTNALVSTIAIILIIVLINFLGIKYAIKIDLTENQLFTLSPQSQELVKNLKSPLKIYVFSNPINEVDRQLLEEYDSYSKLFDYQFVNPQVDIALAQKFNVNRAGDVYVEYESKQQLVQIVSPDNRLSEIKLTGAIAKIPKDIQATIYIVQGHGEPLLQEGAEVSFAQAITSLKNQGYVVEGFNLNDSPLIPPSADVVLVSSGDRNFLASEIDKIQQYLDRGGNLLVMYNAQSLNSLESILSKWGITVNDSLAIDSSGAGEIFGFGPSISIIVDYGVHPITKDFTNGITIFPWARPIITTPMENIKTTSLLITNNLSWGETQLEQENVEFNPTEDVKGPLDLAVALVRRNIVTQEKTSPKSQDNITENSLTSTPEVETQEQKTDNPVISNSEEETQNNLTLGENNLPTPPEMKTPNQQRSKITSGNKSISEQKMVVVGNTNFATDGWFQQQLNSDFFLNSMAWLADEKDVNLSIRPKQRTNRRLNISKNRATVISWLALLIIPGLSLVIAVMTWWRRSR